MSTSSKRPIVLLTILAVLIMCALPALIMTMCAVDTPRDGIRLYRTATDSVEELSFANYLEGCVASELNFEVDYPEHALIAISLSIESRLLSLCGRCEHANEYAVDFCDCRSHGSGYLPITKATELYDAALCDKVYSAIRDALSVCMGLGICYDGGLALTLTHESSYLMTESSENVSGEDIPYLRSVRTYEDVVSRTVTLSCDYVNAYLRAGMLIQDITGDPDIIEVVSRTGADRVDKVRIGDVTVDGSALASALSIGSTDFTVKKEGSSYVFTVRGEGNGVGLSCMGACRLASDGKSFEDIIAAYFPGTAIKAINIAALLDGR